MYVGVWVGKIAISKYEHVCRNQAHYDVMMLLFFFIILEISYNSLEHLLFLLISLLVVPRVNSVLYEPHVELR